MTTAFEQLLERIQGLEERVEALEAYAFKPSVSNHVKVCQQQMDQEVATWVHREATNEQPHTTVEFEMYPTDARTIELPDDVFEALYCRIVKADQDVSHLTAMVISKNACSIEIGSTTFTRAKKEENK